MLELVLLQTAYVLFTDSAPRLIQFISCDIRDLSVCPCLETPLPGGLETSGQRA